MRHAARRSAAAAAIAGALLLAAPRPAAAQQWRTIDVSRQLHDTTTYRVHIRFGAGRISLHATEAPLLYRMDLRYDEEHARPIHEFDAAGHGVVLGADWSDDHGVHRVDRDRYSTMTLALGRGAPMDLSLELGAVQGVLDLGGLQLSSLRLESGASDTRVRFDAPNPVPMRLLHIETGAAGVDISGLANANAREMRVEGGVGSVHLDFGGDWTHDVDADVQMALGHVTLDVPADVGLRVEVKRFLASFEDAGLERRGDAYYSRNWDSARYRLRVHLETTFGDVDIDHGGP